MNILVCGAGVSGIFFSIFMKSKYRKANVLLFDKNKIIGKKILVTGNGRCNIGNSYVNEYSYNNNYVNEAIKNFSLKEEKLLNEYGIFLRKINNLFYPVSLSSRALNNYLFSLLEHYKVELHLEEEILKYTNKNLITNKNNYDFSKLIFCFGGKSMKSTGSDGSLFNLFNSHGYNIINLRPGLAPIRVKENVKLLENLRLKGIIKLINNNKIIYEEEGEVIFKKDGISGISIFNISSIINRKNLINSIISIDLFPNFKIDELKKILLLKFKNFKTDFFESLFGKQFFNYIYKFCNNNVEKYAYYLKNLNFKYDSTYEFEYSQVTLGGISFNDLDENFESKLEKNIYFLGECLDVDGLCGGYNIMFAIYSAYKCSSFIIQSL